MKGAGKMECDRTNRNVGGGEGVGESGGEITKGICVEEAMGKEKK